MFDIHSHSLSKSGPSRQTCALFTQKSLLKIHHHHHHRRRRRRRRRRRQPGAQPIVSRGIVALRACQYDDEMLGKRFISSILHFCPNAYVKSIRFSFCYASEYI